MCDDDLSGHLETQHRIFHDHGRRYDIVAQLRNYVAWVKMTCNEPIHEFGVDQFIVVVMPII